MGAHPWKPAIERVGPKAVVLHLIESRWLVAGCCVDGWATDGCLIPRHRDLPFAFVRDPSCLHCLGDYRRWPMKVWMAT